MRRAQLCDVGLGPPDKGHPALPGLSCLRAAVIQKTEHFLLQLKSITDSWLSPSSITLAMDMAFAIMSGVVLFILLIPFLKNYPISPPPERENTQEVAKRGQNKTRKKVRTDKGCRHGRKNVKETQNILQPFQTPVDSFLRDVTPHSFWNTNEKLKQLPLSHLLSYLKVLESLMWQKCSGLFTDMSSVLSESVVATAWISKSSSSAQTRTVSCPNVSGSFPAQQQAQGHPQFSQVQPLTHQLSSPNLADGTEVQTEADHPWSTPNQIPSSKNCRITCPTTKMKAQEYLPTENHPWHKGLKWKDDSNIPKYQVAISQPTGNIPRNRQATKTIKSSSIFVEQSKILQHHQEHENQERLTEDEGQPGLPFRFLPFQELMHSRGNFPQDNQCPSKNRPELSQSAQLCLLDSKSCKFSKMMGSMFSGISLKNGPINVNIHDPIMEDLDAGAKYLPWASSSNPRKGLDPRNPALWIDQLSYINASHDPSFLEPNTHMGLTSDTMQFLVKHTLVPYLQTLESRDSTLRAVPTSSLLQCTHPSSTTSVSNTDNQSKAARIMENLNQRDPEENKIESPSADTLQSYLSIYSSSEFPEIQKAIPSTGSRGLSKVHPTAQQNHLLTQAQAYCLLRRTQEKRTILGTGRGSLQPSTSSRMARHEPWNRPENIALGNPCWSGSVMEFQEQVLSSVSRQTNQTVEVKQEAPLEWKVTLESSKIPNSQIVNIHLSSLASVEASRGPGPSQTYSPQHSGDPALIAQIPSKATFKSDKQPQGWSAGLLTDCPAAVFLPSQGSVPSYHSRFKNPMTSQCLGDHRRRQEPQVPRVTKDKTPERHHKTCYPDEKMGVFMRSEGESQEERLEKVKPSKLWDLSPSTVLKNIATTESQSLLDVPKNEQAPTENFLKRIMTIILHSVNFNKKDKGRDSLKNDSPQQATVQTQASVRRQKFNNVAGEAHTLMNIVVQLLVDRLGLQGGESPVQWQKVEPHPSQMGSSSQFHEGHYDPEESRLRKRMDCGPHNSPTGHNHPFIYSGIRNKQQSGIAMWRACNPNQRVKRGTGCGNFTSPKGNKYPFLYRGLEDKQSSIAIQRSCDLNQNVKRGMGCSNLISPKGSIHPFMCRGIRDKQQLGSTTREPMTPDRPQQHRPQSRRFRSP